MSLDEHVHQELLHLRKQAEGASEGNIAKTSAIRDLLGNGDPLVAHSVLKHSVLEMTEDKTVLAAAYSLGFMDDQPTHLDRLTAFGNEHYLDQRQVRRLSDRGIKAIANLITSNWTTLAVPEIVVFLRQEEDNRLLIVQATYLHFIAMRHPVIRLDENPEDTAVTWVRIEKDQHNIFALKSPLKIEPTTSSVTIIWNGELWPKWTATTLDMNSTVEVLGAKLRLTLASEK